MLPEPHFPSALGLDALTELEQVDWSSLTHAYGQGRIGGQLEGDVARSLSLIGHDVHTALAAGLYSNVCHQGTVYEATAFALPFVAAVAAGDVARDTRAQLVVLIGDIAVGASQVAATGSRAGAFGLNVDELVRNTVRLCESYLVLVEEADWQLRPLITGIREVTANPSNLNREAVYRLIDEVAAQF